MNLISKNKKRLIIVTGPTAVGKTQLSIDLALRLKTEIISCDSRQLYKETTIGTAKPTKGELKLVKHHFIDHISIEEDYTVGDYEKETNKLLDKLFSKKDQIIVTGGTGLYIKAILEGLDEFPDVDKKTIVHYDMIFENEGIVSLQEELSIKDPEYYKFVDIANSRRLIRALSVIKQTNKPYSTFLNKKNKKLPFEVQYFVLERERKELYSRINSRVDIMIQNGLIDEAKSLYKFKNKRSLQTVGYKELFKYIDGEWTLEFAINKIKQHSRNYAKRQITWFNRVEGKIPIHANENAFQEIIKHIS